MTTGAVEAIACLRSTTGNPPGEYDFAAPQIVVLGREPGCQIVLCSDRHGIVSRRHAEIRFATVQSQAGWWLCDLNSANGTYLNGQRCEGCARLRSGDRITLGKAGPEFIFEQRALPALEEVVTPTTTTTTQITLSQLFPIFASGLDLRRKALLIPGGISVGFVVALFTAVGKPGLFNGILAAALAIAGYYVVYRLCGKHKPWWILVGTALFTALLLRSPVLSLFSFVFRELLPGSITTRSPTLSFPVQLVQMFFGAGLMEELLKALPLLIILLMSSRWRGRGGSLQASEWGIVEPLDGILLGAASAIGFIMIETLGQYVPATPDELEGLQILIPRFLGAISGHMAYSGYFGYFIGLAALRPGERGLILGLGYLTAAVLHTLWNVMGNVSSLLLAIVGILSYAFLATAIIKARSLSPDRANNFATRLK
jgi:RsiW-degrading membrane proteinase PrsW (M82 family)